MGNCARRLTGAGCEETIMSTACPSARASESSNFHFALEACNSSSLDAVALDHRSGAGSSMEPKSEYFSARAEEMMRSKSQFSSAVEHEIEHSKVHWSELSSPPDFSEDNIDYEEVDRENKEVFAELMNDPQWKHHSYGAFFCRQPSFPLCKLLGRKIAEGGQAEIFELIDTVDDVTNHDILWKVFKRGSRLSDLRKQCPCGILRREVRCVVRHAFLLDDGRFGFEMLRCRGDLRKHIDQGLPFPSWMWHSWDTRNLPVRYILREIACQMDLLHRHGILHRDLKAANILVSYDGRLYVADFECSIGVVGTGFWRAPEILLALKNYNSNIEFSKKADVYSYAMTCFEIVTRRLPFEGELKACRAGYDLVIDGQRPKLPSDLDVTLKDLIERCWNPIPGKRPSFSKILKLF